MFILLNFLFKKGEVILPIKFPIMLKVKTRFKVPTFMFINLLTSNRMELSEKIENEHRKIEKKLGSSDKYSLKLSFLLNLNLRIIFLIFIKRRTNAIELN